MRREDSFLNVCKPTLLYAGRKSDIILIDYNNLDYNRLDCNILDYTDQLRQLDYNNKLF